ncbi:MAG TPA: hypothetical protein VGD50_06940, partial [Candidatus Baltobacteraceae bacterium]
EKAIVAQPDALQAIRLAEAFERDRERLLRLFAQDVLARELALAPADIQRLAERALLLCAGDRLRAVAVAPADVMRLDIAVPIRADGHLEPGDIDCDLADGSFISTLRMRVDRTITDVLEEASVA